MNRLARRRLSLEGLETRQLLAASPLGGEIQQRAPRVPRAAAESPPMVVGDAAPGVGMVLPDLFAWADEGRGYLHDYVIEGDLLRFTTALANRGSGNLELRGGPVLPNETQQLYQRVTLTNGRTEDVEIDGEFTYHPSHNHIHFDGYAVYNLRQVTPGNGVGDIVATGGKVSFCLLDITRFSNPAPPSRYATCGSTVQGITAGWSDVYDRSLPDQWINISGIQDGQYWLEVTVDPDNQLLEADESNNTTRILVDLDGAPASRGDRLEPNDSFSAATMLGAASYQEHPALSLHNGQDTDFFAFTTLDRGTVEVQIEFTHSLGDLDLHLFNRDRQLLATSATQGDGEQIVWESLAGGETYFVQVLSPTGASNAYEFSISGPGSENHLRVLSDDAQLPRPIPDGGGPGPTVISTLTVPDLVIQDVNVVLSDLDHTYLGDLHIELRSPSGTVATLLASAFEFPSGILDPFGNTEGFFNTVLDDQAPINLAESSSPFTGTFNIDHAATVGRSPLSVFVGENAGGTWQLRISDWAAIDVGTLHAWGLDFTFASLEDRHEPNDDVAQSVVLSAEAVAVESDLSIHGVDDVDYFRYATTAAGQLEVITSYDGALGELTLEVLDSDLQTVATGESRSAGAWLSTPVPSGELYYIRVTTAGNAPIAYNLRAETRGDFSRDGQLDAADIDLLYAQIQNGLSNSRFDLNRDGRVTQEDVDIFVRQTLQTDYGDANLDRVIDEADLTAWRDNRFQSNRRWSEGDFNGDGDTDGHDFLLWFANRFQHLTV